MTKEKFIEQAIKVHGILYIYNKVNYKDGKTKISITCKRHGEFKQAPYSHLRGKGCPICGSFISKSGSAWLSSFNLPEMIREHKITLDGKNYYVDGYDMATNTIYEYLGRFWHGHPDKTDHTKKNPKNGIPFKVLYERTLERIELFKRHKFNVVFEWGD